MLVFEMIIKYIRSTSELRDVETLERRINSRDLKEQINIDWPQGWISDMSNSPIRSNPKIEQEFLSDESNRVLAIVRRSKPIRKIVRNLRLDKIR
jgi:hypothetical protein